MIFSCYPLYLKNQDYNTINIVATGARPTTLSFEIMCAAAAAIPFTSAC
jgi:hypothetical protein